VGVVVPLSERRENASQAVEYLQTLLRDDLARVNQIIISRMDSPVEMIPALAGYLIHSGGKRLRPLLTLASARLCGYEGDAHYKLAATVEFIHTATLLHDDVVDESGMRRGKAAANTVWGNQASVLVGDFLFARAFRLMVEVGDLKVLGILSNTSAIIAEGEVMQLSAAHDMTTTEDTYLQVIAAKTAALFSAATQVGAVLAGRPAAEEEALECYGRNLGIAFQLVDDALDYSGEQVKLGKTIGDDFREGKITLPVVLAYRRGNDEERRFWRRTMEEGEHGERDLDRAIGLMTKHGTLKDTVDRARHYGAIARDALAIFPESDERSALIDLVDFCIDRAH
jgi:octaprenyl-diphosphate synthase